MHAAIALENNEETLMADYVGGNDRAFHALFKVLGPRVKNFFLRKFGDESLADDMQQITFMKMHRAKAAYRIGEPVRPWLFTIAARVRIDELRKQRSRQGCSDDLELADQQVAEQHVDPVERADLAKRVRAALATLPESQRRVVQLHRYEGMTFKEIASVMGVTEAAVKLRAFRAYGQLRKQLAFLVE
jgi:RNA polymerase sigma factor (sigma-70 family)